jgi:hypothetical protein
MGLRKEVMERMLAAGMTRRECREFAAAKKPDGSPQDLDLVVNSAPFEHMLDSRRRWFESALKPKALGGMGLTHREATKIIDDYYVMKGKRRHKRDVFSWLRISYRPKDKIQSRKKFQDAITTKSIIGKTVGKNYGDKLKIRYAPRNATQKCSHCKGSGSLINLERRRITCIYCNGTGVEGRKFF